MIDTNEQKIKELLENGTGEVIEKENLSKKLRSGKQLRIKFGIDPTASDLHLGHAVALRKLRQFQNLGHKVILLIGDFTATIGDPSGKSTLRPALTDQEVKKNMKNYIRQAAKILDIKKTEVAHNSKWFRKMKMEDFYLLARKESVLELMTRSMFKERQEKGEFLALSEFSYPLLQGYDSVMLKSDVELGGQDQIFNMLHARRIQKSHGINEQDVVTAPLLEGTDGVKKMSKSLGNCISLNDYPNDIYGKIMAIPDGLILKYAELLTDMDIEELKKTVSLRDQKAALAKEIVRMYHGEREAVKAEENFNEVFRQGKIPHDILIFETSRNNYPILDLLFEAKLAESKSDAKRVLEGGGVTINSKIKYQNAKIKDWREQISIEDGMVVQFGKRKFIKIHLK